VADPVAQHLDVQLLRRLRACTFSLLPGTTRSFAILVLELTLQIRLKELFDWLVIAGNLEF